MVELELQGMTCASCAARIERALNGVDGVSAATVNFATERASVDFDPEAVSVDELCSAVKAAGYGAAPHEAGHAHDHADDSLPRRLAVAAALTAPLVLVTAPRTWTR